ncbi:MAG: hypothetical protein WC820_07675 [Spirochaetales bacterium]|jgi:hypothetical protein
MRRKIFFVLLAAICISAASAQEASPLAKLSMWNRGVFNFDLSAGSTNVGPSWMGGGGGVYNSLSLDWSWKDVSWTMTGQWDGDNWNNPVNLRDYSAAYRMFSGFVSVSAGKVRSDGGYRFANFDTTGFSTRIANAEPGVMLCLYPLKGLSFGAFLPIPVGSQAIAMTFGDANFGAAWAIGTIAIVKASYRMEPDADGNKELAAGVQIIGLKDSQLTLGYRYLDVTQEHDAFMDAALRAAGLSLKAYGDLNFTQGGLYYGAKVNVEYEFTGTPFVSGASASYGNGDVWYDDGLQVAAYGRYGFAGGSSVQVGGNMAYKGTTLSYGAEIQYTISF